MARSPGDPGQPHHPAPRCASRIRTEVADRIEILLDSGIRHSTDIAVALALGADAFLLGRRYLYGLGAAGQRGVRRTLDIVIGQLTRTMQLLGVRSVAELRSRGSELVE